jgi:hypothetical protein
LEREKNIEGGEVPPKLTEPGSVGFVSAPPPSKNISSARTDLGTEQRRLEALKMLERHPGITRAFVTDTKADGTVTITLAIRGIGSGQLTVPAGQFDPAAIIQLFDDLEPSNGRSN